MTVARPVARAVASPVARAVGAGIGGGLTLSQVVADAVGYWPLQDNAATTTVVDEGTGANNGVLAGGDNTADITTTGPGSKLPRGLQFDGVAPDYVGSIGAVSDYSFIQNTAVFSVCAWLQVASTSGRYGFIGNTLSAVANKGFFAIYENGVGVGTQAVRFLAVSGLGANGIVIEFRTADNVISDTNWHHVAIVCSTAGQIVYIDGSSVSVSVQQALSDLSTGNSTRSLNIGRANFTSSAIPLAGSMAGVGIWNRPLSVNEVKTLAENP